MHSKEHLALGRKEESYDSDSSQQDAAIPSRAEGMEWHVYYNGLLTFLREIALARYMLGWQPVRKRRALSSCIDPTFWS